MLLDVNVFGVLKRFCSEINNLENLSCNIRVKFSLTQYCKNNSWSVGNLPYFALQGCPNYGLCRNMTSEAILYDP